MAVGVGGWVLCAGRNGVGSDLIYADWRKHTYEVNRRIMFAVRSKWIDTLAVTRCGAHAWLRILF